MSKKIITITVLELIAELGKFPLESPVIVSTDEHGSTFLGLKKIQLDESGSVILWPTSANIGDDVFTKTS